MLLRRSTMSVFIVNGLITSTTLITAFYRPSDADLYIIGCFGRAYIINSSRPKNWKPSGAINESIIAFQWTGSLEKTTMLLAKDGLLGFMRHFEI